MWDWFLHVFGFQNRIHIIPHTHKSIYLLNYKYLLSYMWNTQTPNIWKAQLHCEVNLSQFWSVGFGIQVAILGSTCGIHMGSTLGSGLGSTCGIQVQKTHDKNSLKCDKNRIPLIFFLGKKLFFLKKNDFFFNMCYPGLVENIFTYEKWIYQFLDTKSKWDEECWKNTYLQFSKYLNI